MPECSTVPGEISRSLSGSGANADHSAPQLDSRVIGLTVKESQEESADICGLDRTYIGGIKRGERNVALVNIEKIAKALKISLPELFRGV